MSDVCQWLHERLEILPLVRFPFDSERLPDNGIYFFYEEGETWGHGGRKPRIVRVGTHRDGNFQSRISEHFLLGDSKMDFDATKAAPHERSIFRKNLGRALLNKAGDPYMKVWELDFTSAASRREFGKFRNIERERAVEAEITRLLRQRFSFRFIVVEEQVQRMGAKGLERALIGTLAHCRLCKPSNNWLGNFSPKPQIRESGLWLVQHLNSPGLTGRDERVARSVSETAAWVRRQPPQAHLVVRQEDSVPRRQCAKKTVAKAQPDCYNGCCYGKREPAYR